MQSENSAGHRVAAKPASFAPANESADSIFEDAREKLTKLASEPETKLKIIVELASRLEQSGSIPTHGISAEIGMQLKGLVSPRFVRQCLPEKYKEPYRVKNGKAQSKGSARKKTVQGLAASPPLDHELLLVLKKKDLTYLTDYFKDHPLESAVAYV
jgi:hypothetical protein